MLSVVPQVTLGLLCTVAAAVIEQIYSLSACAGRRDEAITIDFASSLHLLNWLET